MRRAKVLRAIEYMGLSAGQKLTDVKIDTVSLGPARTVGLRICALLPALPRGARFADGMRALVVPGSGLVKEQAEAEGLTDFP